MKVLLCEKDFHGHRKGYLRWLSGIDGIDFFSFAPENTGLPDDRFFPFDDSIQINTFRDYAPWVKRIRQIALENRIDTVHILDGDSIMRHFGYGLQMPGGTRLLITYHNFYPGVARRISYRLMTLGKKHACVVHTESIKSQLRSIGVSDIFHCEYPSFDFERLSATDSAQSKREFGLSPDIPVIGIIGGLSSYKHILPFLRIMQGCRKEFQLLICGRPSDISPQEIENAAAPYKQKLHLIPRLLSEEEYRAAIAASDLIYSLYGTGFRGASGPLTDGVCCRKMILSCAHGSLSDMTSRHHLGVTADVTDDADILAKTETALSQALTFRYDETAEAYRALLKPGSFLATYKKIYLSLQ